MAERSVARMLLDAAEQDLHACAVLAQTPGIGDSVVGFHAQQAVEKSLKALLRGVVAWARDRIPPALSGDS
ncbi:MAG: HEPN domain-containing protein [Pseudomonadota bacterium]|jgi:HEPN domain-containing protein